MRHVDLIHLKGPKIYLISLHSIKRRQKRLKNPSGKLFGRLLYYKNLEYISIHFKQIIH